MRLVAALVLLVSLVAGCLGPGPAEPVPEPADVSDWAPHPCDPSNATGISRNAPVLPGLAGTNRSVATTVARGVDDERIGDDPSRSGSDWEAWETRRGEVTFGTTSYFDVASQGLYDVRYTTDRQWPGESEAALRDGVRDLVDTLGHSDPAAVGIDVDQADAERVSGSFRNVFEGEPVYPTLSFFSGGDNSASETGEYTKLRLRPLYDLSDAEPSVEVDRARRTAAAYDRCVMDRNGKTREAGYEQTTVEASGWAVWHESLARDLLVSYRTPDDGGHCAGEATHVLVDADTGAVLGRSGVVCE